MSSVINVTEEGEVTLVVTPEPALQIIIEDVPDIDLIVPPPEEVPVILVKEGGPPGPPGESAITYFQPDEPLEADPGDLWLDTDEDLAISGLQVRTSTNWTTESLADTASSSSTVAIAAGYRLLTISTDKAARVRLYTSASKRDADASRPIGTDPTGDHGLVLEFVTTSSLLSADLSPAVDGFTSDASVNVPYTVTNMSGSTGTVQTTLGYLRTE